MSQSILLMVCSSILVSTNGFLQKRDPQGSPFPIAKNQSSCNFSSPQFSQKNQFVKYNSYYYNIFQQIVYYHSSLKGNNSITVISVSKMEFLPLKPGIIRKVLLCQWGETLKYGLFIKIKINNLLIFIGASPCPWRFSNRDTSSKTLSGAGAPLANKTRYGSLLSQRKKAVKYGRCKSAWRAYQAKKERTAAHLTRHRGQHRRDKVHHSAI